MLFVLDSGGQPVCGLTRDDIDQFCIAQIYGKENSLSFDIHPSHEKYRHLDEETRLQYGGNFYLIKSVNRVGTATVTAALDLDFLKTRVYHPFESETQTLQSVLSRCLPSGWTVKGADAVSVRRTIRLDVATDYDVLQEAASTYEVQFCWNTVQKTLTVIDPEALPHGGEYLTEELNLRELRVKGDTTDFATRLYCYGKDGMSIASVNGGREYVENHTYSNKIVCAYWVDERYTVPENMKRDAQEKLDVLACPVRTYECDIVDLARLRPEYSFLEFQLNQPVLLIDCARGTRMLHRVMELYQYPFDPTKNRVVLSNSGTTLSDVLTSITNKINEVEKQTGKYIKELVDTDEEFRRKFIVVDESFSEVRQTAKEISMRVTNEVNRLDASITLNANQISLRVTNEVERLESAIQINADAIEMKVTAKDVSLIIRQSANEVMYAFNGISDVIKMRADGFHFYANGTYLGKIGTDNQTGLVFDLQDGSYMAWNRSGEGSLIYYPYDMGGGKEAGLHTGNFYANIVNLSSTLYMNGGDIEDANSVKLNLLNNNDFDSWRSTVNSELSSLEDWCAYLERQIDKQKGR